MATPSEYIPRISDSRIGLYLDTFGAIVVEGPKWCGKTTSAARKARSELRLADPANDHQNRRLAELNAALALEGARPRLLDEWQEVPAIWDAVRYECDQAHGAPGQFLLTGSATPRKSAQPTHSGAGRFGRIRMDTLTLFEQGLSSKETSLAGLFAGESPRGASQLGLEAIADAVCKGGWPVATALSVEQASLIAREYISAVAEGDISEVSGLAHDPYKVRTLIASLARNESTLATKTVIAADTVGDAANGSLSMTTIDGYLSALRRMFFIDDIPAWHPALRSPIRLRAGAKHHLADPSLAAAALGATPSSLIADLKTLGQLFESLVTHDLMVYARAMGAQVFHYHDASDLEVDLIVEAANGDWGAFEVKLGSPQEDKAAKNLVRLEKKLTERGEKPPAVKAVITGVGAIAHIRNDGVAIIPFDTLAP